MDVSDAITKRYSVRGYTDEALTDDELNKIIEAGLKAPTAANKQEIHFSVLKGDNPVLKELEDEKNRLRNISAPEKNFYYEAPVVIFLSADESFHWNGVDAGIAVQNMALMAEELGLGSLIIGCVYDALRGEKKAEFSEKLGFPIGYGYEIAIALGHKAATKEPHTYDADRQVTYL